jgi:TonB family protein
MKKWFSSAWLHDKLPAILGLSLFLAASAGICALDSVARERHRPATQPIPVNAESSPAHASADRQGTLRVTGRRVLRLNADLGSVRVLPQTGSDAVQYNVHVETDARPSLAERLLKRYALSTRSNSSGVEIRGALPRLPKSGAEGTQFWVHFEISVPADFSVSVNTGAGDITVGAIGGSATLITQGGNIRADRIGGAPPGFQNASAASVAAKLETEGGHILVGDVNGSLDAFTAGGHISAGNITGDASLRSGGGHIHAGEIGGRATLSTDGGNITVGRAGSLVNVHTGGGQIDFGEVRGSVHAQTGGGGIRIMYVSGAMDVESSGGSICLTRVAGSVRAATGGGTIRAWINPGGGLDEPDAGASAGIMRLAGPSQLNSSDGDIIVFLPRNLAASIEAIVDSGGPQHIEADPALALRLQAPDQPSGVVRASTELNGGGAPLKLHTVSGHIRLQYIDSQKNLRESLIREQRERLQERLREIPVAFQLPTPPAPPAPAAMPELSPSEWSGSWFDKLELAITGGVREDADVFRSRLVYSPPPQYPLLAKRAGLEGMVHLQVQLDGAGHVQVLKVIDGEPALADAAIAAVQTWRGKPVWMDGKPINVASTVTFHFQLH